MIEFVEMQETAHPFHGETRRCMLDRFLNAAYQLTLSETDVGLACKAMLGR